MPRPSVALSRLQPRLDRKPWGGRKLARFGPSLPAGTPIGEAVVTAAESIVLDGPWAGRTLAEWVNAEPATLLGPRGLAATGGRPVFPLLIKLIDAAESLSIQVHPDDTAAAALGHLGKTEAYHVLEAEPGSVIGLGLRPGITAETFLAACRAEGGGAEQLVRWLRAVPGTTYLVPAGTLHALGAGCVVYEVQQPSNLTYRFHDGGRVDANGRPRQLHIDQGAAVLDAALRPEAITPLPIERAIGRRDLLAACRLFALERIVVSAGEAVPVQADGSPQALTCLEGTATVSTATRAVVLRAGETAIVGASGEGRVEATEPAVCLRAWVPDLRADIVEPALAAHADDAAIAALAGPSGDLLRLL